MSPERLRGSAKDQPCANVHWKKMNQAFHTVSISTHGPGLYEITDAVVEFLRARADGLLTCFIRHTSASLLIQENADPDVQKDLQDFFAHLAKSGPKFRHTTEGPDDMPSHIRAALTQTSIAIPVKGGKPVLGTWQGLYVFEHRDAPHRRGVLLHYVGE
jgi:secondary thiamine-phosphate synthase enzyme